jgi:hypothetical protein
MDKGRFNYKIDGEIYFPQESDGICKRKSCINHKWGTESALANGYCVDCWDRGYGFKKNDIQFGYRFKEGYIDEV